MNIRTSSGSLRAAGINNGRWRGRPLLLACGVVSAVLLTSALPAPAAAQWYWRHPQPQGLSLRAVDLTDALHGTVVGDNATILTTTDGGKTWLQRARDPELVPHGTDFSDVSFADQANGLAIGHYFENNQLNSLIVGTTDGGVTWEVRETFSEMVEVLSISFVGDTAMAAGRDLRDGLPSSAMIWRSEDGGFTWETIDHPSADQIFTGIAVVDESIATVVGSEETIWRTNDGGETWDPQDSGTTEYLLEVSFTSSEVGTAVGGGGTIVRTTDGGTTWTPQVSGTTMQLEDVSFSDANNGAIVGAGSGFPGVLLTTSDGGATWTSRPCETWCFGIDISDAGVGTMVGPRGAILRTTDGGDTWSDQTTRVAASTLRAVSYVAPDTAIAVGGCDHQDVDCAAPILRTEDGGNTWVAQESGTMQALRGVSFVDRDFGIAVGGRYSGSDEGVILRTLDGGDTWSDVTPADLPDVPLLSVHCTDVNHCTAVGNGFQSGGSVILRTEDGGDTWDIQDFPGTALEDVFFTDAQTGTAVGGVTILRTTDGGATWVPQDSPTGELLSAVTFFDADMGIAVGGSGILGGVIIRTTDGGENWVVVPQALPDAPTAVSSADASNGAVVTGAFGHIYRTHDGGASWQLEQQMGIGLADVSFVDAETGITVGENPVEGSDPVVFKTVGGPTFALGLSPSSPTVCAPDSGTEEIVVGVTVESVAEYTGTVDLSTSDEPAGVTSDLSSPSVAAPGSSLWTVTVDETVTLGRHRITLTGDDGALPQVAHLRLGVVDSAQAPAQVEPADGAIDVDLRPTFTWEGIPLVDRYRIQVATDAAFEDVVLDREGEGISYTASTDLASDKQHFWRVQGTTGCSGDWSDVYSFVTRPQPLVEVAPEAVDFEVPAGGSDGATLTIANVGTGNLDWSIATAQPPTATTGVAAETSSTHRDGAVARPATSDASARGAELPDTVYAADPMAPDAWYTREPELGGARLAPGHQDGDSRAAVDLASTLGRGLPSLRPIALAGGAVDCETAPGLIVHDDGTIESGYSGDPATVDQVIFADRFTPTAYPRSFSAVCLAYVTTAETSLDLEIVVFDDDGADGGPGTELGALAVTITDIPTFPNETPVWASFDISPLGIVVDSGSVYIGARWSPPSVPNVFLASDQSSANPPGFAGGYWWNDVDSAWAPIESGFPPYRSMFIRAQEDLGGCQTPSEIPWLSVTPESGSTPEGGSTPVEVAVDAAGLAAGVYEASLCVASNDAETPLVVVPVGLVVTEGGVALAFDPSSLEFGDVDVGDSSAPQLAVLENLGSSAATGLSLTAPGSGFEVDAGACDDTLPGGGSCEVSVTFAPSAPGTVTATVTATSDQGPTAALDLAGNGIQDPPQIDVDPDSLSSTLGEGETETSSLTLTNSGDLPLEWEVPDEDVETFERLGAITLESGVSGLESAVIDPAGAFAYFGDGFGRVVKIDLATFERVGALPLESLEIGLASAVIDPAGEFAYFGTTLFPPGRVVKIDLATFERVGAITLESGESDLRSAVIDPAGEFAYFGTDTNPGRVVKIDLATFERVSAITLESNETGLTSAVIDPAGEFAYFGTTTNPARVVKIDLATFERVGAIALEADVEEALRSAVIDPAGEFAYFGTGALSTPGRVVKINLQAFERVGAVPLEDGEVELRSAVIDPAGEFAYFGTRGSGVPGRVVKIDLDTFERVDALTMESNEQHLNSAVIDPAGEFAYFASGAIPPNRVIKIDLRLHECTWPDWVSVAPTSGSVPRDGSQVADVTFDATGLDPGDFAANLCVSSNDPDQPVTTMPLALTVTPPAVELTFDPASLEFGDVEVGGTSAPLSATLLNSGVQAASGLTFDLGDGAFLADAGNCGDSLPAGGSCTVSVTFSPTAPGPATATLVAGSAEGASTELGLSGNGVAAGVVTSTGLEVDPEELLSDGNGVFEPGEVVIVAPWWRNDGSLPKSLAGTASQFVGPDGVPHTVEEESASYGTLDPGQSKTCLDNDACYALAVGDPAARPASHWEATFDEALDDAADTGKTWTLHVGGSFTDVPPANLFYSSIETLLHSGVTGGCVDDRYCPGGVNTRAQMPVFVLRALEGPDYVPPPCDEGESEFSDVPAANPFCPWIEDLAGRGIVAGCGNDNYCPSAPVTRAQMAIFLLKTLEGADYTPSECSNRFDDVPCPSLFADWIEELAAREITGGCSETEYCPGAPVSRAQMAVFVTKTFGLTLYGP